MPHEELQILGGMLNVFEIVHEISESQWLYQRQSMSASFADFVEIVENERWRIGWDIGGVSLQDMFRRRQSSQMSIVRGFH